MALARLCLAMAWKNSRRGQNPSQSHPLALAYHHSLARKTYNTLQVSPSHFHDEETDPSKLAATWTRHPCYPAFRRNLSTGFSNTSQMKPLFARAPSSAGHFFPLPRPPFSRRWSSPHEILESLLLLVSGYIVFYANLRILMVTSGLSKFWSRPSLVPGGHPMRVSWRSYGL